MAKKNKKSLKDVVLEYEPTPVEINQGNVLKQLRAKSLKIAKESFWILVQYGVWALLLGYAYQRAGFEGLAISGIIAILYKLDKIKQKELV